jgi:hypothetical protein
VTKLRKRSEQIGRKDVRCCSGVGMFYKDKIYQRVQVLNNVEKNDLDYFENI